MGAAVLSSSTHIRKRGWVRPKEGHCPQSNAPTAHHLKWFWGPIWCWITVDPKQVSRIIQAHMDGDHEYIEEGCTALNICTSGALILHRLHPFQAQIYFGIMPIGLCGYISKWDNIGSLGRPIIKDSSACEGATIRRILFTLSYNTMCLQASSRQAKAARHASETQRGSLSVSKFVLKRGNRLALNEEYRELEWSGAEFRTTWKHCKALLSE